MTEKAAFALATFPLQFEAKKTRESRGIIYNFLSFSFRLLSLSLLFCYRLDTPTTTTT